MTEDRVRNILPPTGWHNWKPKERGVLLFVFRGEEVLLIHKKRGLGAGKINGPGGRIELGETPAQAAIRETREEVGLDIPSVDWSGELHFQFADGYSLLCSVFTARPDGLLEPIETDEAKPLWCSVDAIPYEQMWQDDQLWFPHLLAGRGFVGWFRFDGETMTEFRVDPITG